MDFNDLSTAPQTARKNARQQVLMAAVAATAKRRQKESDREKLERREPVTGLATDYDTTTGDWLVKLQGGGTVRSRLNSNGAPVGRVPVQRSGDSQISDINAPPSDADLGALIEQIDVLSQALVSLMGANIGTGDPNNETVSGVLDVPFRYPNDLYFDEASGTLFRYNSDLEATTPDPKWVPLIQVKQGFTDDPNDQGSSAVPVYLDGAIAATSSGAIYTGDLATGDWTLASGTEIEDMDLITDAGDGSYQIITSSSHRYTVEGIDTAGTGTVTLSPTIGQEIAVDASLTATLSGNDDTRYSFTVHLRRV